MNIAKEVEKYQKKKESLLNSLVGRLQDYAQTKVRAIFNISSTIKDLEGQKDLEQEALSAVRYELDKINQEEK